MCVLDHVDSPGRSERYCSVMGMAWMIAGPCGRSITINSRRFADLSGPRTKYRTGSSATSSTTTAFRSACSMSGGSIPCRCAERSTSTREVYYETHPGPSRSPPSVRSPRPGQMLIRWADDDGLSRLVAITEAWTPALASGAHHRVRQSIYPQVDRSQSLTFAGARRRSR